MLQERKEEEGDGGEAKEAGSEKAAAVKGERFAAAAFPAFPFFPFCTPDGRTGEIPPSETAPELLNSALPLSLSLSPSSVRCRQSFTSLISKHLGSLGLGYSYPAGRREQKLFRDFRLQVDPTLLSCVRQQPG